MADKRGEREKGAAYARRLVIMAKSPRLGRVKRRLAAEIGGTAAIAFYRVCLANTVRRLGASPRWRTLHAVTPDIDAAAPLWPVRRGSRIEMLPQGDGDLGARMQSLFERLPPGPAVIVGSDIPAIGRAEIAKAFGLLGHAEAVLGPAGDGGYWLIGLKRTPRIVHALANVRWSSPHAFADTLANLKAAGARIALAPTLRDVDTSEAYRDLRAAWQRLIRR